MHVASRKGQEKAVSAIIRINREFGGRTAFDLNQEGGSQKWSALHLATHGGHQAIVADLIAGGADLFQRNILG